MDVDSPRWCLLGREETSAISNKMFGDVTLLLTTTAIAGGNTWELAQGDVRWRQVKLPADFTRKLMK